MTVEVIYEGDTCRWEIYRGLRLIAASCIYQVGEIFESLNAAYALADLLRDG